ncbi:atrial natriuretic peptide receptor 1 isoform X1 [Neocloeon triangulifer]|uniref:atrial natriuretic peptide receptor 1 isoform X1 n=2 Tax=Neocloeon triangulifer TaxID=2078957 RepID=UPI00286F61FD|nr:atrial natriuretic peptide receptor 1 isoform X1 [Neocloeon triangulifer]
MLLLPLLLAAHAVLADDDDKPMKKYNVAVLMASRLDSPFDLERCGPAIDLALKEVNEKYLKMHGVQLEKVQRSYPSCSNALAPGLASDLHYNEGVIAFIGPACAFALEPVARLAAYWDIPIITGMGDQPPAEGELSVTSPFISKFDKLKKGQSTRIFNKTEYPTLTRMSYCQCRLRLVFASIFRQFKWHHVALILDKSDLFSFTVGRNLEHGLKKEGFQLHVREFDGSEDNIDYADHLQDVSIYARVIILSVRGPLTRNFLLEAYYLNMTRGDWAFLDVELFENSYWGDHGWHRNDTNDTQARQAYQSLLRVSLLQPRDPKFKSFAVDVRQNAERDYNYTLPENEEVNFFIGAFYDGVILLGMSLNETLTEGGEIVKNGVNITKRMWNRNFPGITGQVRIDENGDRDADYSLYDFNPKLGKFEEVGNHTGINKTFKPRFGRSIHWPNGKPPPDEPECGFLGKGCLSPTDDAYPSIIFYVSFALLAFIVSGTTLACITYRHVRAAADLNNMSWRVRPEDIKPEPCASRQGLQWMSEGQVGLDLVGLGVAAGARGSVTSSHSLNIGQQAFTTVGIFKGTRVAVKKVARKKVDVNKKLLWEIKQVRDVTHENTVRFVGACIDASPGVVILTEYCPKGSLKDVLENEAITLDWNFRMSLIHDMVKGMCYIHGSELGVHGKLRSANCLIDGRFVLKISDFGLHTLTTPSEVARDGNFYTKLLWVAPELLPLTIVPGTPATQKGDVYSFAIILEEIIVRGGPYEAASQFLGPQDVVARVAARETPPFRPAVAARDGQEEDLKELMEKCWADIPDERPSFEAIRTVIRRLMKGHCENLMDDLLRRMEQYATNLEALVSEKTEALSQEKRRSEELLYQVLPRQVAEQLMSGQVVQPEQFECVTIYFSDIVGFTSLCVHSTPMQVVGFLNDLYSTFDKIIGYYDVYKVETIGDAYMVVSGLPTRNGDAHAREVALLALAVLDAVKNFTIAHRPDAQLEIRIGIHSGPVCAGVVGHKMPHYCLFGDTVNTASRMESSGLALRIHVSDATKQILSRFGTFQLELRGEVELKGKGRVTTYWLLGCTEPDLRRPPATDESVCHGSTTAAPADGGLNAYPLVFMRPAGEVPEVRVTGCDTSLNMEPCWPSSPRMPALQPSNSDLENFT